MAASGTNGNNLSGTTSAESQATWRLSFGGSYRELTIPAIASLVITPGTPSVAKGNTQQFKCTATYTDGSTSDITSACTWSVSDGTKASISNTAGSEGLATTTATGSVTITAYPGAYPGLTATVALTITAAVLVSITVTPAPVLANGGTQALTATGTYSDGSTADLTGTAVWSSSAPAVATVGAGTGIAAAVAHGQTTVTATVGPVSGTAVVTVDWVFSTPAFNYASR